MAKITAFCGLRPRPEIAERFASLPYDVLSVDEAKERVKAEPLSFLRIVKPEVAFDSTQATDSEKVQMQAAHELQKSIEAGDLIRDEAPCLYLYRLTYEGRSQTGLVAGVSANEYQEGRIKKHEATRAQKEAERVIHIRTCRANTGPTYLTFRDSISFKEWVNAWVPKHESVSDFVGPYGVRHQVWVIDEARAMDELKERFEKVEALYIADGHHRSAAGARVAEELELDDYLAVIFPHDELRILPYNRVVSDLNGLEAEEFLERLRPIFDLHLEDQAVEPRSRGEFGFFLDRKWYRARLKVLPSSGKVSERLDVAVLQSSVLDQVLGIENPRTDKRIDFVGGVRGLSELERRCTSGEMRLAISVYPTAIEDLLGVADEGDLMPPKSTWFEPKLLSGLIVKTF